MPITVRTFARLDEAAAALVHERDARYLGGGTLVMRAVNEGDTSFKTIVRSEDAALWAVRTGGSRIELGAGVSMAQVLRERELAFLHPVALAIGGPALRSMATVGGNLLAPTPYGDFATALLALDASVSIAGGLSAREMPLEEFLVSRGSGGGLVASVAFGRPSGPDAFRFAKMARVRPKGLSVVSIAAHLPMSGGRVASARVAYGAMASTPIRVKAVERALEGRALDRDGVAPAIAAAAEGTAPASDALASDWYRREMAAVQLRRVLLGERP